MIARDVPANDACTVRLAGPSDHFMLQTVLDGSAGAENATIHGVAARQLLDDHQIHLAFVGDRPIGCIMATRANVTVIHGLNVVTTHRGRGHASALIRAVMVYNDEAYGRQNYWTAASSEISGAISRFQKLGFQPVDELRSELTLMIRRSAGPPVASPIDAAFMLRSAVG